MAIYRNGVRVKRPSSEPSSGEASATGSRLLSGRYTEQERSLRLMPGHKIRRVSSIDKDDTETEPFQVGDNLYSLPKELLELDDLGSILSINVWNHCLSEEDRKALSAYLPDMEEAVFKQTLEELFTGRNFNFNSPMGEMLQQLKNGMCDPKIFRYLDALRLLEKKAHYHHLRIYHNSMINACMEMKNLWLNYSDSGINEQLKVWHHNRLVVDQQSEAEGIHRLKVVEDNNVNSIDFVPPSSVAINGTGAENIQRLNILEHTDVERNALTNYESSKMHAISEHGYKKLTSVASGEFFRASKFRTPKNGEFEFPVFQTLKNDLSEVPLFLTTEPLNLDEVRANFQQEEAALCQAPVEHVKPLEETRADSQQEAGACYLMCERRAHFQQEDAAPYSVLVETSNEIGACLQQPVATCFSLPCTLSINTTTIGEKRTVVPRRQEGTKLSSSHLLLKPQRLGHVTIQSVGSGTSPHITDTRANSHLYLGRDVPAGQLMLKK